jgi:2-(3-amino-3-carboxypropyl)histidine synthase
MKKSINEIEEIYDLEIDRVVKTIKKQKAKKVLLQFPNGMKPYSQVICDEIEDRVKCQCFIWLGSCFGACDLPLEVERLGVDLIVQFGHSSWSYDRSKKIKVL